MPDPSSNTDQSSTCEDSVAVGILMRPKRAFYVSQTILASLFWCVCSP